MVEKKKIGPYTIAFPIKSGKYAKTFRVIDEKGNKRFLKLFNLAKLADTQYENSLEDITEVSIVKKLSHINVEGYIDSGEVVFEGQRYVYMVCDFIVGETVFQKTCREGYCSVYDLRRIVSGVLNGLKHLHKRDIPIIHNELTPENIMLDMSNQLGIAKIIDFGHAQYLDSKNKPFYSDGLSLFYMAPEMFKGLYSTRTDLYSVGVMMYHLLFGTLPWYVDLSNVPVQDRVTRIIEERKTPLKIPNLNIFELDENLLNIIAKAVSQDVDERFQSAEEFLRALNGETEIAKASFIKVDVSGAKQKEDKPIETKKGNGFADVAGMSELKHRLNTEIIDLIKFPEKYKKLKVKIPNGMLLYGPPGCGKTFIAEKFAEELGCNYMYVHCSDVASPYIHGGQEKIAALFEQAKEDAPTILFLDELDAMIADRSRHTNVSEYGEVNEFLTHLNKCADNHIFVIGATNNPKAIDPAALRSGRLDIKMYVPAPDAESRALLFKLYLKDISDNGINYDKLVALSERFVSKDISTLVNKAALLTAQADKDKISMDALMSAFEKSKGELPSVSADILKQHEQIRDEFEGNKNNERPKIGFT